MVLYVFYDFATTQNTRYSENAKAHVTNVVCVQQFCARCEDVEDDVDCLQWCKRRHSFWDEPVGDLLYYLCELRLWATKIVTIAPNAKAFEFHFIFNRAMLEEM